MNSTPPPRPARRRPARNSILERPGDRRPVILFVSTDADRRQPVFAHPAAMDCLLAAWRNARNWVVGPYVIMPDHVHFLCTPGAIHVPDFHGWMKYWKTLSARTFPLPHARPLWQRQCWDTQIRRGEHFSEKWEYIRSNPVRKGFVANPDDWPYQGELFSIPWRD